MARATKSLPPKPNMLDLGTEDNNMFADLKVNRYVSLKTASFQAPTTLWCYNCVVCIVVIAD